MEEQPCTTSVEYLAMYDFKVSDLSERMFGPSPSRIECISLVIDIFDFQNGILCMHNLSINFRNTT